MDIVLASASPRLRELLTTAGLSFRVLTADTDESVPAGTPPDDAVSLLAERKAAAVKEKYSLGDDTLIIAADTVVYHNGMILGKPKDEAEARSMLRSLAGREHIVITGIGIVDTVSGRTLSGTEHTIVYFHPLEGDEIDAYIACGESMDKAGAYGIQGKGSLLVRKIDGDYFNVMGLPLSKLYRLLLNIDADILKKTEF